MTLSPCGHEWIIRLTQQLNEKSLDEALFDILSQELGAAPFAIYINKQFDIPRGDRPLYASAGVVELDPEQIKSMSDKIQHEKLHITGAQNQRCVFPIYHMGKVIGFVDCYEYELQEGQNPFTLTNILNVYANQLYLLYQARRDPLTGLLNRQTFDAQVLDIVSGDGFLQPRDEGGRKWYLAMVDIDHFKQVNDTFGHVIGDEVIILVARILSKNFRSEDYVFRYGGEEFAVLMMSDGEENAFNTLERMRNAVAQHTFPQVENLTVSIGFCELEDVDIVPDLVHKADLALYEAKHSGRNKVVAFSSIEESVVKPPKNHSENDINSYIDSLDLF